jgi:hypothetical protein
MKNKILDRIAIATSLCCALHCALVPILLTITALSGLQFLRNPLIEWCLIILGFILAYLSLNSSLKQHQNHTPKNMSIIGVSFLVLSRLNIVGSMEVVFTCLGSLFLIIAHFKNIQANRKFHKSVIVFKELNK